MHRINAEKVCIAFLPTPLHQLKNLRIRPNMPGIFIKRDDMTGLALGGNKTRKLEYLMADAVKQEADVIITAGAAQSNHCRQTAAAAAMLNLRCVLLLGGDEELARNGNLLLDELFGARIVRTGSERQGESLARFREELTGDGGRPYVIPYGGSNHLGALGYVSAMGELMDQLAVQNISIDRIYIPTSSCGTQAGLVVGARLFGFKGLIEGICVDKTGSDKSDYITNLADMCNRTARFLGSDEMFSESDMHVDHRYTGAGYGIVGMNEIRSIHLLATREGILLDPVYTGRAMGAVIDMIMKGEIISTETILFWHTGGTPSIFAYAESLQYPGSAE
jgi:L-cysteate sulfo-lyase